MTRGGDFVTDLDRKRKETREGEKTQHSKLHFVLSVILLGVNYIYGILTTVNSYNWPVVLSKGAQSW